MMGSNIEIGMSVTGKIYLHVYSNADEVRTPFDVNRIVNVLDHTDGSQVVYGETSGIFNSFVDYHTYHVTETKEEIEKAIEEATKYRTAALEKINSLLKEG